MRENANDNALPARQAGLVPIVGSVGDDGRVTLFRPIPRPASPPARPALRLVEED